MFDPSRDKADIAFKRNVNMCFTFQLNYNSSESSFQWWPTNLNFSIPSKFSAHSAIFISNPFVDLTQLSIINLFSKFSGMLWWGVWGSC